MKTKNWDELKTQTKSPKMHCQLQSQKIGGICVGSSPASPTTLGSINLSKTFDIGQNAGHALLHLNNGKSITRLQTV